MDTAIRVRACVAIVRDGRILLVPHVRTGAVDVQWNLPGGQVQVGERLRDAAVREAAEETGLTVHIGELLDVSEVINPEQPWHSVTVAFHAGVIGGAVAAEAGHRFGLKAPRWFSAADLAGIAYHPRATIDKALA